MRREAGDETQYFVGCCLVLVVPGDERVGPADHDLWVAQCQPAIFPQEPCLHGTGHHAGTGAAPSRSDSGYAACYPSNPHHFRATLAVHLRHQNLPPACADWDGQQNVHSPAESERLYRCRPLRGRLLVGPLDGARVGSPRKEQRGRDSSREGRCKI